MTHFASGTCVTLYAPRTHQVISNDCQMIAKLLSYIYMKVNFDWIKRKDGTSEFEDYLDSLPDKDAEKLLAVITAVEDHGLLVSARMKWTKKLEDDLYELRSKQGSDIQRAIYFQKVGPEYLITHGFTKKSQKTPKDEIEHAKAMRKRYLEGDEDE